MILTTKRHGRTKRDIGNLVAHLNKQVGQQSRVVRIGNVPLSNVDDIMDYMTSMRDASRATVACHHISISPRIHLTEDKLDDSWSYVRIKAAARTLEADFGEDLTPSRMTKSVVAVRRTGRDDVADMLTMRQRLPCRRERAPRPTGKVWTFHPH